MECMHACQPCCLQVVQQLLTRVSTTRFAGHDDKAENDFAAEEMSLLAGNNAAFRPIRTPDGINVTRCFLQAGSALSLRTI